MLIDWDAAKRNRRLADCRREDRALPPIARITRIITKRTNCPTRPPCVPRIRPSRWFPASECSVSGATRRSRASRANSTSMRFTSWKAQPRLSDESIRTERTAGTVYRKICPDAMQRPIVCDNYTALPLRESFNIEYWSLEEAKLKRMPPEKELSRKVALIVGRGAGNRAGSGGQTGAGRRSRRAALI